MTTCMPTCDNFSYMMLNLVGEVGEFASKIAKAIRKNEMVVNDSNLQMQPEKYYKVEFENELKKEAGDILWQLSGLCYTFDWELEEIAKLNLEKLADRKKRNMIDGNGDNR